MDVVMDKKNAKESVAGKISHLYCCACLCGQQLSKTDYRSDYSMQITLMSMPKINLRESARFNPALIKNSNEEECTRVEMEHGIYVH